MRVITATVKERFVGPLTCVMNEKKNNNSFSKFELVTGGHTASILMLGLVAKQRAPHDYSRN